MSNLRNASEKISTTELDHAAEILKTYALDNGMTYAAMSRQCLVSDGAVSDVIGKRNLPRVRHMQRLALGLGMSLDALLGDGIAPLATVAVGTPANDTASEAPESSGDHLQTHNDHGAAGGGEHDAGTALGCGDGAHYGPILSQVVDGYGAPEFQRKLDAFFAEPMMDGCMMQSICYGTTGIRTAAGNEYHSALVLYRKPVALTTA